MTDVKISALPSATTPLTGTEILPIVQGGTTDQVTVANLTAGRAVSAASLTLTTTPLAVGSGGTGLSTLTSGYIPYASSSSAFSFSNLYSDGSNLGLGVTPSAWGSSIRTLDIGFGTALTNANSATATWLSSNAYYTTQWLYKNTSLASYYAQEAGIHKWFIAPSGTANTAISFTQAMTLDASGRLGIGVTTPTRLLQVYSTSDSYQLRLGFSDSYYYDMGRSGSDGLFYFYGNQSGANGYVFGGVNGERLRISSDGTFRVKGAGTAGSTDAFLVDGAAPASAARIDSSGNLLVGTTTACALLTVAGPVSLNAPTTKTSSYSMTGTDSSLIFNGSGSITLTLQAPANYPGRILYVKTIAAQTVVSASSNVAPRTSATAGTAILSATAGSWAMLQSDGTNWVIMAGA